MRRLVNPAPILAKMSSKANMSSTKGDASSTGVYEAPKDMQASVAQLNTLLSAKQWSDAATHASEKTWETFLKHPAPRSDAELGYTVWWMLGALEAHYQAGDYDGCHQVASSLLLGALQHYNGDRSNGLVIGNPWFHLRVAQIKWKMATEEQQAAIGPNQPGSPLDEITRAVSSAGYRILDGDDDSAVFRQLVNAHLVPPQGFDSWEASAAAETAEEALWIMSEFPMTCAHGYIKDVLLDRLIVGDSTKVSE